MISQWYELKSAALLLRKKGNSIRFIEKNLGVPRSTLSGWFKGIKLSDSQLNRLNQSKLNSLKIVNNKRVADINILKQKNDSVARRDAATTLSGVDFSYQLHLIILSNIYKNTSYGLTRNRYTIAKDSDPNVIRYVINILTIIEKISDEEIKIKLKLDNKHSRVKEIDFWSRKLNLKPVNFTDITVDNRYKSRANIQEHGLCIIECRNVALIDKLVYLNKLFYERVLELGT